MVEQADQSGASRDQSSASRAQSSASRPVTLSESAARRINELVREGEHAGKMLRVSVSGGGCSGFLYGFTFDATRNADDELVERDGAGMLIDEVSWNFLAGSEVHFVEEMIGSYFTIKNPNAASTCGCGLSFAVG
jgi:iron-sulfur cluster insertion protein